MLEVAKMTAEQNNAPPSAAAYVMGPGDYVNPPGTERFLVTPEPRDGTCCQVAVDTSACQDYVDNMTTDELLADKVGTAKWLAAQAEDATQGDSRPDDAIQCLRMLAETATRALETAVKLARERGLTWDEIGKWLGVTRQAAQQRFGGGNA